MAADSSDFQQSDGIGSDQTELPSSLMHEPTPSGPAVQPPSPEIQPTHTPQRSYVHWLAVAFGVAEINGLSSGSTPSFGADVIPN